MLKSSDTLLIAGGDSWTDPYGTEYYELNNVSLWPEIVSKEMGWDLINVGRGGNSNDRIFNSCYEAITKYASKYKKVYLIVFWSEAARIKLFNMDYSMSFFIPPLDDALDDERSFTENETQFQSFVIGKQLTKYFANATNHNKDIWSYELNEKSKDLHFVRGVIDNSYRQIHMLDTFCKFNNISILHGKALDLEWNVASLLDDQDANIEIKIKIKREFVHNLYWRNAVNSFTNVIHNSSMGKEIDLMSYFDGKRPHELFPCQHPTQEGMNHIAENVLKALSNKRDFPYQQDDFYLRNKTSYIYD